MKSLFNCGGHLSMGSNIHNVHVYFITQWLINKMMDGLVAYSIYHKYIPNLL